MPTNDAPYDVFVDGMLAPDNFADVEQEAGHPAEVNYLLETNLRRLLRASTGMAKELGEYTEHVHDASFHGLELNRKKVVKEIGDILFYLTVAANAMHLTLDEVAEINRLKLRMQYPNGYDASLKPEDPT